MLIMPLLSRLLSAVIITHLLSFGIHCKWYRTPPPTPPNVTVHSWFITEWNKGLYPAPKRSRFKTGPIHRFHTPSLSITQTEDKIDNRSEPSNTEETQATTIDAAVMHLDHVDPISPRSDIENLQLQANLYSLTTPGTQDKIQFGSDAETICIDTGASACISRNRANFITMNTVTNLSIKGIGTGLPIAGIGVLRWSVIDDANNEIDLFVKDALYVPTAPMGLLCPQQIAQQTRQLGDGFNALSSHGILTFEGYKKTVPYDEKSRLPIMCTLDGVKSFQAVTNTDNTTLSKNQKLLLKWHHRLSHMHFGHLQDLAWQGRLPKAIAGCEPPLCKSCQFGKAHRRPVAPPGKAQPIDANDLHPGDCVSVDQIESSEPGFVDIHIGKPTTARYHAASLYTDHASRFMFLKCHYSTGGAEAIDGKQRFEQLASTYGVKIKAYRGDNGIMAKRE
jgi:hypothetical protein